MRAPVRVAAWLALITSCANLGDDPVFVGEAQRFAPGVASTDFSEVRLTISPDGKSALWFSRDRPGGAGDYDIWLSRRPDIASPWSAAQPVSFNTPGRDFDPAFSADGSYVYFCSDRAGGLGGDDLWRARVLPDGFAAPEHLGPRVNSAKNEWAPMLAPDGQTLLFSSDGLGGAGRMDLFTARVSRGDFETARPVRGEINSAEDEFDATYLGDGSILFTRAADLTRDHLRLFHSRSRGGRFAAGTPLPTAVNTADSSTYAPMLDWSQPDRITFTTRRPARARSVDVYVVRYHP
jgi:TolB protein